MSFTKLIHYFWEKSKNDGAMHSIEGIYQDGNEYHLCIYFGVNHIEFTAHINGEYARPSKYESIYRTSINEIEAKFGVCLSTDYILDGFRRY